MKKNIVSIILIITLFVLSGCAVVSKTPTKAEGPNAKISAQMLYENGWPEFSFSYPSGWVPLPFPADGMHVFGAGDPIGIPSVRISIATNQRAPLKYFSRILVPILGNIGRDIEIIEDKAVTFKNDMPAREIQLDWVTNDGVALTTLFLCVKKADVQMTLAISSNKGSMSEDLKAIAYSLEVNPDKEVLAEVPADVQQFLDSWADIVVSHNMDKAMSYYSEQYQSNGRNKDETEIRLGSVINTIPSWKFYTTKFRMDGNKGYLGGYLDISGRIIPFNYVMIRDEQGQWLWYGNQIKYR